jgi:thiamine biosynthesis lipoprotein
MKISHATAGAARLWRRVRPGRPRRRVVHFEGVLGTSLEIQIVSSSPGAAQRAETAALAEIDRLEAIYSTYSPGSEFSRWQESFDEPVPVSPDLALLLRESELWRTRTNGTFNPAVEGLTRLWSESSAHGEAPDDRAIDRVTRQLAAPLWSVSADRATALRCTRLPASLNAFAKGFIIDRAAAAAGAVPGVVELLVNIGGDLRHRGEVPVQVGIASPFASADNVPPAEVVRIRGEGLATSGGYRRGFRVGDRWLSHLLDPRTGYPARGIASASVVAGEAAAADVLATAFSILSPPESVALADSLGVSCLLVAEDGTRITNGAWEARALTNPVTGGIA